MEIVIKTRNLVKLYLNSKTVKKLWNSNPYNYQESLEYQRLSLVLYGSALFYLEEPDTRCLM